MKDIDDKNKLTFTLDFNKLMVPTPQEVTDVNGDGVIDGLDQTIVNDEYNSIGWVSGMFQSFTDAPDGFSEELKEIAAKENIILIDGLQLTRLMIKYL